MALVDLMGQRGMVRRVQELFPGACVIEVMQVCETAEEARKKTWDLLGTVIDKTLPLVERYERGAAILEAALEKLPWRCTAPKETCAEVERRLQGMLHELGCRIAHERAKSNEGSPAGDRQES